MGKSLLKTVRFSLYDLQEQAQKKEQQEASVTKEFTSQEKSALTILNK